MPRLPAVNWQDAVRAFGKAGWRLLLEIPELKKEEGPVVECLRRAGASEAAIATWKELVAQEILPEDEDAKFLWTEKRQQKDA
jgi:hypothetical protein